MSQVALSKLLRYVALELQPLTVVESPGFRQLVLTPDSRAPIPSRNHLSYNTMIEYYQETKSQVQELLGKKECHAITTDLFFQWLIQKQFKIVCLQETFCTAEFKNDFNQNWDGTILHSFTDSVHSRGVCIMMCKDLNCEVLDSRSDQEGRILMIKIKLQDDIYNIINIYAPNNISERNAFLKQLIVKVENFTAGSDSLVLMGDFNTAMTKIDRKSGKIDDSTKYLSDLH